MSKDTLNTTSSADTDQSLENTGVGDAASCDVEKRQGILLRSLTSLRGTREIGIFGAAVAIFVILSIFAPRFLTPSNLLNVARQISLMGIIAVGMTYVFISGELDLSVGSQYGFMATIVAMLIADYGVNPWVSLIMVIFVGLGVGMFNGLIITKFAIPSFIVTLGMMSIFRGLTLLLTNGWPITMMVESSMFTATGGYFLDTVPMQIFWLVGVMLIAGWVLAKTKFGYHAYATGGNKMAARLSGINTDRVKIISFMIISGLTGLAGAMYVGWLGVASPLAGTGMELNVIAAVIIGGASLSGGSGTMLGTLLGCLITGMITNGLVLLGVSAYWEPVAKGSIIIGAVMIDTVIQRKRS